MKEVNFAGLVAPLSPGDFLEKYWEKKFIHQQHNDAAYFEKILTPGDIDSFLSRQNLNSDGIKLVNKGEKIPASEWTKSETLIDGTVTYVVSPEKLFKLYSSGATIIINSAQKGIPRLADACRVFEQEMKIRVQANIYITPPHSQGFSKHYDPHDIFSMQIKGPKTWQIYDSDEHLPTTTRAFSKKPVLVSKLQINSGDLLYMPRGTVHEAFSSEVSTIHVNFSCKPRYGFHLLEELAKLAEHGDPFFRLTIPRDLENDKEINEYAATFSLKLNELLAKVSPRELLEKQQDEFITKQTLNFQGNLTNLLLLEKLSTETTVSRRKGFTYQVKDMGKEYLISFGSTKIKIPAVIDKAIFLQDTPFKVSEITGLVTAKGKLAIAREFIEAGFLQIKDIG